MLTSTALTPRVLNAVSILFDEDERPAAMRLLEQECGEAALLMTGDAGAAVERIRLAVLKLSSGRLPALQQQIKSAQQDWRDPLVFAGFGDDIHAHLQWVPMPQETRA